MTILWFIIWLLWDLIGDEEPLLLDPVNFWTGALIFAVAVDLSAANALRGKR